MSPRVRTPDKLNDVEGLGCVNKYPFTSQCVTKYALLGPSDPMMLVANLSQLAEIIEETK